MQRHSNDDGAAVHELDDHDEQHDPTVGHHDGNDDQDDDEIEDPPLGDPFALAIGCDLLKPAPGVPGCWASMRCDCGRAFKIDLLTDGRKPCPGCGIVYSHCLLVGPADDPELVTAFIDSVHSEPDEQENDQDRQQDDDEERNTETPIDTTGEPIPARDAERETNAAYMRHNADDD